MNERYNLSMMIAKMAFPDMDPETVKIVVIPDDRHTKDHKVAIIEDHHFSVEHIPIRKFAIIIQVGYGSKSNTLVWQQTTLKELDKYVPADDEGKYDDGLV
jgi:hypothetical protein